MDLLCEAVRTSSKASKRSYECGDHSKAKKNRDEQFDESQDANSLL